jgi:hypothetical protein
MAEWPSPFLFLKLHLDLGLVGPISVPRIFFLLGSQTKVKVKVESEYLKSGNRKCFLALDYWMSIS